MKTLVNRLRFGSNWSKCWLPNDISNKFENLRMSSPPTKNEPFRMVSAKSWKFRKKWKKSWKRKNEKTSENWKSPRIPRPVQPTTNKTEKTAFIWKLPLWARNASFNNKSNFPLKFIFVFNLIYFDRKPVFTKFTEQQLNVFYFRRTQKNTTQIKENKQLNK